MADKKISALTGATTPLAGTEVLPIVQGSATVKVSVANLTAGRAVAMAGGSFTDNITQGTAAKGVNFSANTPAAGMTSQLLNWYEEGTWTPVLGGTTGQSGQTYTRQLGQYTKVGRQVTVTWDVICSNVGTMSGSAALRGLPFTVGGNQGYRAGLSVGDFSGLATVVSIFSGITVENTTDLQIRTSATAATGVAAINATSLWSNGTQLIGAITYFV